MKRKFISLLFVISILFLQSTFTESIFIDSIESTTTNHELVPKNQIDEEIASLAPSGEVEIIKANYLTNPSFEEDNGENEPNYYECGSYTNRVVDSAYQIEVHSGTYGSYISVEGTEQSASYTNNERQTDIIPEEPIINQKIYLDFWYNCKSNPDLTSGGQVILEFQIITDIGYNYLDYYLSSDYFPSINQTTQGFIDVRGSLNSWININRNITKDFVDIFPTRDISVSSVQRLQFQCYSPEDSSGPVELLVDDVSLTNETSFNFFSDNGDFEDGDSYPWSTRNDKAGFAYLTANDSTEGSKSLNLTAQTLSASAATSSAYMNRNFYQDWVSVPKGLFAKQSEDLMIEFDWKYTDTKTTDEENAYFYFTAANETFSFNAYYYFGDSSDTIVDLMNSSYATYAYYFMEAENFSIRNNWNHFSLDVYDLLEILGYSNLALYRVHFHSYVFGSNKRAQLLIDDLQLITYPLSDPSFENNFEWYSNDPIIAWQTQGNPDYVNITTDAYYGNYAANITSYNGYANAFCRRDMFLPLDNELYLDFMWRLDKMGSTAFAYSYIAVRLDGGARDIFYSLGASTSGIFSNSSSQCFYYVDGFNQTGVWTSLFRNIAKDVYTAFGENNWNITQIDIRSYSDDNNPVITIVDELHFVEDRKSPDVLITSPSQSATVTDDLLIEVDASDEGSGIDYVEFFDGETSLSTDSSTPYSYLWNTRTVNNGAHEITVVAHDNAGNTNGSFITVNIDNDKDAPEITNLQLKPATPRHNKPVEVLVEVSDFNLEYVSLFYKINNGSWVEVIMTLFDGNYTGMIPAAPLRSTVNYYIEASDSYGQISSLGSSTNPNSYDLPYTAKIFFTRFGAPIAIGVIGIGVCTFFLVRLIRNRKVA